MLFNAFSPLNGGAINTYSYKSESPFDFDAGLDYTRPKTGTDFFPFPVVIGYIDGFAPQQNSLEFAMMKGKNAFGPGIGLQSAPDNVIFPNIMGSLMKVSG